MRSAALAPIAGVITMLAVCAAERESGQDRASERVAPRPLHIDMAAVDRNGNPVSDLRPQEFEVWITGYRVPIESVKFVSPGNGSGRTIVLLLDDLAVPPILESRVKDAARHFVRLMGPDDRLAVMRLDGDVMTLTNDPEPLRRAIDNYHTRSLPMRRDDAGRHVLTTVATLARQLAEVPGDRKVIVGIGAGWLLDRPIPGVTGLDSLAVEWVDAMRAAASSNVVFYAIDPAGLGIVPRADSGSSGFARETGGHAFINTNDVEGAVESTWREAATYYVLTVGDPPFGRKLDLREVDVRVLRKGVTVRARRGIGPATRLEAR
jgi:VWFA-related protein